MQTDIYKGIDKIIFIKTSLYDDGFITTVLLLNKEKETIPSTDNMPDNLVMARVARQDIQNRINHIKNIKFKFSILNTMAVKFTFTSFYYCLHIGSFLKI